MNDKPLSTLNIALLNLRRKVFRTMGLVLLAALLAFTLLAGSVLSQSLDNGLNNLSQRMGADILAVPYGYEANVQGALLRGEPSTFYFDELTTERIAAVGGVIDVSPQLYLATLDSSCCAYPVQLIGFDPQTDFAITPWVSQTLDAPLTAGQIVIGSSLSGEVGQKLEFFNKSFVIVARLEKTGMGFDTSVFMDLDSARQLAQYSKRAGGHPVADNANLISSVMVRVQDGLNTKDVANDILQSYGKDGVRVVVAEDMISDVSSSLRGLTGYILVLIAILWILTVGVLLIVTAVTINSRRREFSLFRVLGATKGKLMRLILCESSIVSLIGTVAGMLAAALVVFPFSTFISMQLGLPYLQPSLPVLALLFVLCFIISLVPACLASIYGAVRIGKLELSRTIKEAE
ncbi:MAG: FtsX-like permease family protein [Coriobacteriales bacterium]|jgi:putative ABC transport system permease protein|nr:FtsX-like permease family protein [Coriobacteriales bacterium]